MRIIDHSPKLDELKKEYGEDYFRSEAALEYLQNLWGVETNKHGVIRSYITEVLVKIGGCSGKWHFCKTSKNIWLMSVCAMTAISGTSSAPSVFDRIGYYTEHDARMAAIAEMIPFFETEAVTKNSCSSQKNKAEAQQCVIALKAQQSPQLSLF